MIGLRAFFLLTLLGLMGCSQTNSQREKKEDLLPQAEGGFSDIIVVAEDKYWTKGLADDFNFVFCSPLKGLYNPESNFDIVHIRPKGFSDLFKKQRVIVEVDISTKNKAKIGFTNDKYAEGQLYLKLKAENMQQLSSLLLTGMESLREKLSIHRTQSIQNEILGVKNNAAITKVKEQFGSEFLISKYFATVTQEKDFLYLGRKAKALCESGHNSQCGYQLGLFITALDYTNGEVFSEKGFTTLRDSLTRKYIQGPNSEKETYMEIEEAVPQYSQAISFKGSYCKVYKGWWNMVNATMGGPFISYLILDEKNAKLYLLDGFVFAPNFKKRDFLNEMEAVIKTFNKIN